MDPDYLQLLLKYHTHNFSDCLANCERMSMCRSLLYSTDYAHCLLMSRSPTICSVPLRYNFVNDSRYMSYVRVTWHCCHSPRISKLALKSGFAGVEKQQSGEWPCGCLTSTNVFVKRFDCNAYSGVERFMDNQTCKNARIHCSVGQCFRILKTWGNTRWWFYLVYTGYENFVFRSHNASFVHIAGSDTCQFYSASVLKETQRIINRTEWGASDKKNTKRKTIPLKLPVPEVLIGNLTERLCFCRTREACANLLVDAQQRHFHDVSTDFPYNFMIGPDGNVFEGLGWLRMWRSSAYESLNPHLLVVFVGNFTNSRPHLDAVMAGRRLIQTGVSMGHIAVNYSVRLAGSLSDVNNTLYTVVGLWPHYQGRTPLHCSIFHHITVLVNFLMVVLIVALIIAVVRRFFYPSHSRHCAGLLTDLQHCGGESSIHVHNIASRRHQIDTGSPEEEPLYYLLPELRMPLHQRFHIQYASCFWLSPTLSQRSQHRSCRCALSLLLQQHQATATPLQPAIHLPSLAPLGSSCSWASLVLFCPSFSILQPSIIVIAHLPNTDSRWLQRTICTLVANFQARRCFCRRRLQHLELSKLQTKPQSHDFVIMDPRKIVHRPVQHCKFWTNFTGLPYLVLD